MMYVSSVFVSKNVVTTHINHVSQVVVFKEGLGHIQRMCPKLLFSKTVSDFEPFEIIFLRCEVTWFKRALKPSVVKKNRTACACHFIYSIKKLYPPKWFNFLGYNLFN